jgi:hypothetical protein
VIAGAVLTPLVAPAALGVIGFSAAGPVAGESASSPVPKSRGIVYLLIQTNWNLVGSIAAGLQAGIGNVAAGSLFAAAQSVAMGGALSGAVTAVGAGIAGITGAAIAVVV